MKTCPNCGAIVDDSTRFCGTCGTAIPASEPVSQAPAVEPVQQVPAVEPVSQTPAVEPVSQTPVTGYGDIPRTLGGPDAEPAAYSAPQPAPEANAWAPASGYPETSAAVAEPPKKSKKTLFIIIGIAAAVVIAAVVVLIIVLTGNKGSEAKSKQKDAESAVTAYFDYSKDLDIRGAAEISYESNFDKSIDEDQREEKIKNAEDQMEENKDQMEALKGLIKSAELKITKNEELSDSDVSDLKDQWSSSYRDTDKIEKINEIGYSISVFGSSQEDTCYAVLIDGLWYVKDFSSATGTTGL